ncbi:MAG TPA: DUF2934 domain-containing protein [Verrucomicrobiae bacterium]|nr:DUF2934 domain-containing protein [Verrucomicrobiae bacterium]
MKTSSQKRKQQYESAPTIKTPMTPPTVEEIRQRAHEIFLTRGGIQGKELDDWLMAEQELIRKYSDK